MTVKKKFGFYGALLMVAVCSMVVGMFIASSLKIDSVSQASPFWKEGSAPAQMKVPLPSFSSLATKNKWLQAATVCSVTLFTLPFLGQKPAFVVVHCFTPNI